jgi:hypothetical protein
MMGARKEVVGQGRVDDREENTLALAKQKQVYRRYLGVVRWRAPIVRIYISRVLDCVIRRKNYSTLQCVRA